ncbi:uncharacterized protein LOC122074294 [Macadamia integrifolia]|uniref:uncharacterized protein LOC122074294 n=1 Tax=Macadamia integrifolia TaxID=60698 RepID=UPI001C4F54A6|nr:uncharacterized protein LOC122074294 [Macadamia integrifolia]
MVRKKDKFWEHVQQLGPSHFKCNYCELDYSGSVTRVKAHLACLTGHDVQICTKVPDHVQAEASVEMNLSASKKKRTNETLESGIGSTSSLGRSIHQTTMTESFIQMMKGACAYGQGFVIPSYSTLRTRLIPEAKVEIMEYVSNIKSTWGGTGCTIMSDSWTDLKKRSWVNVIAHSPGGAVFLKCIDCGSNSITAGYLFREISNVIEMLGSQHVVQFISDNGANYNCCGDMLIGKWSHMYRTNCAAHGINLLLKDIHKHVRWAKEVIAFMDPLIRILRLVDSDGSTACYLYEATVRAKEKLRKLKESDGL